METLSCTALEVLLYAATSRWLFIIPLNVSLPELTETGSRSGCCRVVLRCGVIAPSCLGQGYFWLPPCLNPVVILQWIIHVSSLPSRSSHLLPLSPSLPPPFLTSSSPSFLLHLPILPFHMFVSSSLCLHRDRSL